LHLLGSHFLASNESEFQISGGTCANMQTTAVLEDEEQWNLGSAIH
jgi:hypothetical protein